MEQYVGLDVSLKLTAICIVDRTGKIERERVVASDPETIAAFVKSHAPHAARIGLETGATSTWLWLGANVGTTLIVQVLSFNISEATPVLFIIGLITFRVGGQSVTGALGRIAIGLGLILLALHILVDTLAPAEQAPAVRVLLGAVTHDPVLCIVIAAALTWAAHSSVAVVLLIMSLAYLHFVTAEAALALVLGANLGAAINPLLEGARRGDPASRRPAEPGALYPQFLGGEYDSNANYQHDPTEGPIYHAAKALAARRDSLSEQTKELTALGQKIAGESAPAKLAPRHRPSRKARSFCN
jgi:hypothetical protein